MLLLLTQLRKLRRKLGRLDWRHWLGHLRARCKPKEKLPKRNDETTRQPSSIRTKRIRQRGISKNTECLLAWLQRWVLVELVTEPALHRQQLLHKVHWRRLNRIDNLMAIRVKSKILHSRTITIKEEVRQQELIQAFRVETMPNFKNNESVNRQEPNEKRSSVRKSKDSEKRRKLEKSAPETLKESRLSSEGWTKSSAKPSKKSKHARMQNARPKCRERSKNGLLSRRGPFKRERRLRPRSEQSKKNKLDSKRHEKTTERGSSHK